MQEGMHMNREYSELAEVAKTLAEWACTPLQGVQPGYWYQVRLPPGPGWAHNADAVIVQPNGATQLASLKRDATGVMRLVPWESAAAGVPGIPAPPGWERYITRLAQPLDNRSE